MDRTADKSTPKYPIATGFPMPWHEALKRAGSFDELRPYLHTGQIPACHGGLFTFPDGNRIAGPEFSRQKSGPSAHKDRAGRVIFFTEPVVLDGRVVQEEVFAYDRSIELDSVAFDTFFPVAGLPPAEQAHPRPLTTQAERGVRRPRRVPQADPGPPSPPKETVAQKAAALKDHRPEDTGGVALEFPREQISRQISR